MLNHGGARLSDLTSALHVWPAGKTQTRPNTQTQTQTEMGYSVKKRLQNKEKSMELETLQGVIVFI